MIGKLIILGVLLHMQYISTSNGQPESPLPSTCNNCCQGQTGREGNPGIPGVPGTHGHPGTVGPKGDRGESLKGERGDSSEKGDSGSPGLKGEQGFGGLQGLPGKTGPMGIARPGVKGQKGEMGQTTRISAFSAVRSSTFTPPSGNVPLPFQQFHTNVGDDFDLASGRFTCEVPGIYMFTYSILTHTNDNLVNLMKDNTVINSVYDGSEPRRTMLSNAAVLQLNAGEQVWLQCYHSGRAIYSNARFYTTFSGVLLHEL